MSKMIRQLKPRAIVQVLVLVLTAATGLQFLAYVAQVSGTGPVTVENPPGVGGFLPIGAFLGWKNFLATAKWDPIHPASMVIFGYAILISALCRKSFCGWFCPIGTLSRGCYRLGERLFKRNFILPAWLDFPLRALKYVLLGFFVYVIVTMSAAEIGVFQKGAYYRMSDVKMLFFFTRMSLLTFLVLLSLFVLSLFIKNFWCRYLCPYGALLGLFSWYSPSRVVRDPKLCKNCGSCARTCAYHLGPDRKKEVNHPLCTGCFDCIGACKKHKALSMKTRPVSRSSWSVIQWGSVVLVLFFVFVYGAKLTGHWQSRVSDMECRRGIIMIDSPQFSHP